MINKSDERYQHIDKWQAQEEKKYLRAVERRLRRPSQSTIDKAMAKIKRIADKERARITKLTP